jgi:hypothetical protein
LLQIFSLSRSEKEPVNEPLTKINYDLMQPDNAKQPTWLDLYRPPEIEIIKETELILLIGSKNDLGE